MDRISPSRPAQRGEPQRGGKKLQTQESSRAARAALSAFTTFDPFPERHADGNNEVMDNMITVITRFPLPAGLTAEQIRIAFEEAAPKFRNVSGLVRKQFLHSSDCRTAGGVYLWNDEPAARAFMTERVAPMIRTKFQVEPAIEYYASPVIVEN